MLEGQLVEKVADNVQRQSTICELTFPTRILSIKMNRKRLVVVLEDQIYVYDISNMNMLHTIETSPNPHGEHFARLSWTGYTDTTSYMRIVAVV